MQHIVIVFGATGQIGPQVCRTLAANGYTVGIHYHANAEKAAHLCCEIERAGGRAFTAQADVREPSSVASLLVETAGHYGSIDGVVNLIHRDSDFLPKPVAQMDWADWAPHLDALHAHFNICKAVLPYMKRQQYGRIVYLSGGLAYRFYNGCAAFSAVKAGANAFSKTLALEAGPDHITVNIISPGRVVQPAEAQEAGRCAEDDVSRCPLGRFAQPEDVAQAALFFLSPGASFVTGQTLYLAGGEIMPMP